MNNGGEVPSSKDRAIFAAEPGGAPAHISTIDESDLDDGDVTIDVMWSGLNYKDALAITGRAPVVRRFPMICGIDLAGRVRTSSSSSIRAGEEVLVVGCGLGEEHHGGYATIARVPASFCEPLPVGLRSEQAMAYGTAGTTAMLSLLALERGGLRPGSTELPILVTGASGGVGSLVVALLGAAGYEVVASTGRTAEADFLTHLGASKVIGRDDLTGGNARPLVSARFAGAIDVVGGATLASVLSMIAPGGIVASCGHAGGSDLSTTVFPFILRGITLAGINSVHLAAPLRRLVWERLATAIPVQLLEEITTVEPLDEAIEAADRLFDGTVRGRVVFDVTTFRP